MSDVSIHVLQLDPLLPLPSYAKAGDAGADLPTRESVTIAPGERATVGTGLALAIPAGYVGLVHPRSGLAARCGLTIVNAPGTIDAGYRGEVKVCLLNTDARTPVQLNRGDLIAQLVIQKVEQAQFVVVSALDETERGAGGYGSTGGAAVLTTASLGVGTACGQDGPTTKEK